MTLLLKKYFTVHGIDNTNFVLISFYQNFYTMRVNKILLIFLFCENEMVICEISNRQ